MPREDTLTPTGLWSRPPSGRPGDLHLAEKRGGVRVRVGGGGSKDAGACLVAGRGPVGGASH